jgi:K+-sensing histidine kinase KdpD
LVKFISGTFIVGAKTLLLVAFATLIIVVFRAALGAINLVTIVYLLPVLVAALRWGTWPAIAAAIAGATTADFFFYPPLYSFWISDTQNIADLIVFLIVAVVSGNLAADLRRREQEIESLYQFSRRLAACYTTSDLIRATQNYLSESLRRPTVVIEGELLGDASAADAVAPRDVQNRARALVSSGEFAAQRIFDAATRHVWLTRSVSIGATRYVALVDLGTSAIGTKRRLNRRLDAILADAANSLVRLDLAEALEELKLQGQSDTLKTALVATMSHELRNPLVSIIGAASVLEQITEVRQNVRARSLVETVRDEAVRLDDNIKNLIDTAIITTGVERAGAELSDPVDMVRAAIELKRTQLADHKVEVTLAPDLPLVRVQTTLIENALGQLLDNAAKYSPANSMIKIEGYADKEWLTLSVSDQGAGLTAAEHTNVGQRSFRGARHAAIRGSGLGLWIATTFVVANGGRLDSESPGPSLGTTIRIRLPAARDMGQD